MDSGTKRRKLSSGNYEAVSPKVETSTAAAEDSNAKEQRRSLFVRSLPASVTTERLTEHFSQSFPLKHALVVLDPQTKVSKGFGFVTFADAEDAQAAVEQFNNSELDGRKIKVELAQSRHRETEDGLKSGPNTTAVQLRAEREQKRSEAQPPRLIVRNLPWSITTEEALSALFRSYGKVKHAVLPKKGPKVQYGFGFVLLRGKKNAEKAIAGVNGKEVDGRTLAVDWAVDKETWEQQKQTAVAESPDGQPTEKAADAEIDGVPTTSAGDADDDDAAIEGVVDEDSDEDELDEADDAEDPLDADSDIDDAGEEDEQHDPRNDGTVFIRNLPFTANDESLKEHFSSFGPIRYARVVYDPETERSRGTAFVSFFNLDDAKECVKNAPKQEAPTVDAKDDKKRKGETVKHSVLQNEATDPSGKYTLEGRVLQISRALTRSGAERKATEASEKRDIRDRDKRRLYLLSEGSIPRSSKLYEQLGKAEIDIRESSARQRQRLIKNNPNLCFSLTRLSVRNIPRHIGAKELKALAREAVVGFTNDAKAGIRQPLSKEESRREEAEMREAERKRKVAGKGIVKQAKVVYEDSQGTKVKDGAGRSRGYGFIEYHTHRNALAGLRWLNGHVVKASSEGEEKGKRLIVEFAIENAQVLQRRGEIERRAHENRGSRGTFGSGRRDGERRDGRQRDGEKRDSRQRDGGRKDFGKRNGDRRQESKAPAAGQKRKRGDKEDETASAGKAKGSEPNERNNSIAKRNRIIAKKRQARKVRKG
ncbi:RNA recognition motif-containing protein [Elasticomyces elasticus]|uniref:RNA recognition motif-containing protein n=1 Tax=Exophiala sideris TaxID=1016849 RepID=A0ABR0JDT8_9EURO|nr:RNA recognition motif-containing protein [Elasticomyces elasticus]KAK5031776.1 RNA recognition motif-containing protein [Exophiala sideris]KAK5040705.1 RNA recognition motif-containing protein [Exophiala sideris]KAK5061961.1 RNA recognition motif-containing protein [Exophiala sideris]KAK5184661.1 RNA recognition motif-containing protein [Eurotiomycetes sp. CCFEE 6388]